jgi:hypothetical protein
MSTEESALGVVAYQAAFKAFREAEQAAKQLMDMTKQQVTALEKWQTLPMTGIAPGMTTLRQEFEPSKWPSGESLRKAIDDYRIAGTRLWEQWKQLKDPERIGFREPSGM